MVYESAKSIISIHRKFGVAIEITIRNISTNHHSFMHMMCSTEIL